MRKGLLTALLTCFSVTGFAQYTQETALDLEAGTNTCAVEEEGGKVFWKYTPEENTLLTITPTGNYVQAYTIEGETQTTLQGATNTNQQTLYYLEKGTTCYFWASGSTNVSFDASMQTGGNVGKGLSADDPLIITPGEEMFMGRSIFLSNGQTTYATYSATEDGVLVLTSTAYASISVNNSDPTYLEYSNGHYIYNLSVKTGQNYNLTFSQHYNPFILTAEMTHPQPGSADMPFDMTEGDNTVPAANGEYWYTFTNDKTGYGVISSNGTLPRGDVKIYNNKSNITYGQIYAQSTTGSYDIRFEMPSPGTTYYICVNKVMGSDEDETFNFTVEDYAVGDKEENPILLEELPATQTLKTASGTYYYAVNVPAGTHKFLHVKATTDVTNEGTSVAVYPTGNSWNAISGNSQVRAEVDGSQNGQQYIIRWASSEATPITFSVALEDIQQGDVITNPLTAQIGDNTISGDGTKYYTYTATLTGKLIVKGTPEMAITFPMGTGQYDGNYQASFVGSTYTLDVTDGNVYYIKIENAKDKDVFSLSEEEYQIGESRDNPFIVEDGTFTLDNTTYTNYWLQYTATKDGILVIKSDIPYNYTDQITFCKSTDPYTSGLTTTIQDGENYTTIYQTEVPVNAGDVYLVNLRLQAPYEGNVVTFTVRDAVEGETIDNPIVLVPGQEISLPTPPRIKPIWCKATLDKGTAILEANYSIGGTYYKGKENIDTNNGQYLAFSNYDENYQPMNYYLCTLNIDEAGDYYFKFDQGSAGTVLTLTGTATSIKGVNADDTSLTVTNGTLNIHAKGANVKIYTLAGAMIASKKVADVASFHLESGMYIVKINNSVKKITIR